MTRPPLEVCLYLLSQVSKTDDPTRVLKRKWALLRLRRCHVSKANDPTRVLKS
jgi:hypothetical protein